MNFRTYQKKCVLSMYVIFRKDEIYMLQKNEPSNPRLSNQQSHFIIELKINEESDIVEK